MIQVIAIGKKHEPWIVDGLERYQKRLRSPFDIKWQLIAHSSLSDDRARQEESERLLAAVASDDFIILLDERGRNLSSPELAELLEAKINYSKNIKIIIGGAYGVNDELTERADLVWSLSRLVFPHQLVRLILVEQLYRVQEISHNRPYHHQ